MSLLYYIICLTFLWSSFLIFTSENPVHSVLFLILAFFESAILLFIFNVEFLGIVFIIIYVGAIAVLFLFIIMMLNNKIFSLNKNINYFLITFFTSIFLSQISSLVSTIFSEENNKQMYTTIPSFVYDSLSDINVIAQVLFNYYNSCFLLTGLILLVAMVGAIYLTLVFKSQRKSELLYKQLSRTEIYLHTFY